MCSQNLQCETILSTNSKIKDELLSVILRKAALFKKSDKEKK